MENNILFGKVLDIQMQDHNKSQVVKLFIRMDFLTLIKGYMFLEDKAIYQLHLIKNILSDRKLLL